MIHELPGASPNADPDHDVLSVLVADDAARTTAYRLVGRTNDPAAGRAV